jgi:hypothetical protein
VDRVAQAGDQRVVQVLAEPDDNPGAAGLAKRAVQRHLLGQVVADREVLGRCLDGGLVDDPVALQGVDIPGSDPPADGSAKLMPNLASLPQCVHVL